MSTVSETRKPRRKAAAGKTGSARRVKSQAEAVVSRSEVLIIGAGFAGLGSAIRLRQ